MLVFYTFAIKSVNSKVVASILCENGTLEMCKGVFGGGSGRVEGRQEESAEADKRVSSGEKLSSTSQTRRGAETGAAAAASGPAAPPESQRVFHLGWRRRPQKFQKGARKHQRGRTAWTDTICSFP